ncbi:MAG: MlrC C-terminal domain-containing protein, partial [Actinomycetota bacterium]
THLLRAMIEAELKNSCFASIFDPEVAEQAHAAGTGATIDIELGGKHDDLHGKPITTSAYVKSLTDGRFTLTAFAPGMKMDLGKCARLSIDDIDVIVASAQSQIFDPEIFLLHGIDVTRRDVVALKSSAHFRAGFRELAKEIITTDPPGVTTSHVEVFDRRRADGKLWPRDEDAAYTPRSGQE